MRNAVRTIVGLQIVLLLSLACSGSTSPNDDDDNENPNQMGGTVGGVVWTPTVILASKSGTRVSIFGRDAQDRQVTIDVDPVAGSGSYSIGASQAGVVRYTVGSMSWVGHLAGATGAVVITTLTDTYMTGSYSVTLVGQTGGASGPLVLTGTFTGYFGQT